MSYAEFYVCNGQVFFGWESSLCCDFCASLDSAAPPFETARLESEIPAADLILVLTAMFAKSQSLTVSPRGQDRDAESGRLRLISPEGPIDRILQQSFTSVRERIQIRWRRC